MCLRTDLPPRVSASPTSFKGQGVRQRDRGERLYSVIGGLNWLHDRLANRFTKYCTLYVTALPNTVGPKFGVRHRHSGQKPCQKIIGYSPVACNNFHTNRYGAMCICMAHVRLPSVFVSFLPLATILRDICLIASSSTSFLYVPIIIRSA